VRNNELDPSSVDGIDETDVKILKILQADGRIALSEIARRLDLGTATVHERTDDLEEEGFIREYRADLDEGMLGFSEVAFINVKTEAGRFSSVAERLAEHSAIQEIHEITGDTDLLLKVLVRDRNALTNLLSDVGEYDGVLGTETNIALGTVKDADKLDL
jgi:Lrp/AsnC family transcriptional regulator for asnA, asnC and gidA